MTTQRGKRDMEIIQIVYWIQYAQDPILNFTLQIKDPYDMMQEVKIKAKNI